MIHNHAEITGVVLQVIVIDAEKQAAGTTDPDGAAIVADKKVIARGPDTADERRAGTIRHGTRGIIGRVLFAIRTGTTIGPPADFAARLPIDGLSGCDVDAGIAPGGVGYHGNLLLAQTTWPSGLRRLGRFVSFHSAKLNSRNLVAIDPPEAAAEAGFLEFDDAVLKRDQLALDTAAIAQYKRVGAVPNLDPGRPRRRPGFVVLGLCSTSDAPDDLTYHVLTKPSHPKNPVFFTGTSRIIAYLA